MQTVSPGVAETLHQQLKQVILDNIASGRWSPGAQIPSERNLCERYRVSRTTTRRTISDLVHEGTLYTVSGKGTFVATPLEQELAPFTGLSEDLRRRAVDTDLHTGLSSPEEQSCVPVIDVVSRVLGAQHLEASDDLAKRLRLRTFTPVAKLKRLRFWSGQPISIQSAYLPEHLCPGLLRRDFATASLFRTLREDYGLKLERGHTVIKAGLATSEAAELLELQTPAALLRTFQTTFLDTGEIIEYCESVYPGDQFELTSTAWQNALTHEPQEERGVGREP